MAGIDNNLAWWTDDVTYYVLLSLPDPIWGSRHVMVDYAITKNNSRYVISNDEQAMTITMNGKTANFSTQKVAGHYIVNAASLAFVFGMNEDQFLHQAGDRFDTERNAAIAFGLMYNPISSIMHDPISAQMNGIEYQAFIYKSNIDGKYFFDDVTAGINLTDGSRTVQSPLPTNNATQILSAWAHTHGYDPSPQNPNIYIELFTSWMIKPDPNNPNMVFYQGDGIYSENLQVNGYVFTPGGQFKELNQQIWSQKTEEDKKTYWVMDSDPSVTVIETNFPR